MMPADLIYVLSSQQQRTAANADRARRIAAGEAADALARACKKAARRNAGPHPHVVPLEIAALQPGDSDTVLQVFDGLGPRSRQLRFLTAKPRLTGADLDALTDVDGRDRVALVARRVDGHAVGIARFVRDPEDPTTAEAAVTVADAWQRRGIGTRLARALTDRARELGITRISLTMAHDNNAAESLMHRVADDVRRLGIDDATVDFEISLAAERRRGPSLLKGVCT